MKLEFVEGRFGVGYEVGLGLGQGSFRVGEKVGTGLDMQGSLFQACQSQYHNCFYIIEQCLN